MRNLKLALIGLFLAASFGMYSQSEKVEKDTAKMIVIYESDSRGNSDNNDNDNDNNDDENYDYNHNSKRYYNNDGVRFGMLDIGLSTYLHDNSLNLPSDYQFLDQKLLTSYNVGVHLINTRIGFSADNKPNVFGLMTGLRINIQKYAFDDNFRMLPGKDTFVGSVEFVDDELKKNRLLTSYLAIPFLFDIDLGSTKLNPNINFSFGYVANILLAANHKIKSDAIGKEKVKDNFNLNKYMGMLEARIGLGPINIYAQYGLGNLLALEQSPELTPINIGINVIPR